MTDDVYVWDQPRVTDDAAAGARLAGWHEAGGDPQAAPFEPSGNVAWFHRELRREQPDLELVSDAVTPDPGGPIWLATDEPAPARIVAIGLPSRARSEALDSILGLAAKYDLVVFDARAGRIHEPLAELAAYADATFWPGGAIQAGVAGGLGAVIAIAAWIVAIPVVSGVAIVIGGFLFVMAVSTFVHHGRQAARSRRGD